MADDEDGSFLGLSLPQRLQLGAIGVGTLLFLFTYLVQGLLNGFAYVNDWIWSNPVPVLAYWSIQIGLVPVYRNTDLRRVKLMKQSIYSFLTSGAPFAVFIVYYQIYPPQTWIDGTVHTFSYLITSATFIKLVFSSGFNQLREGNSEK